MKRQRISDTDILLRDLEKLGPIGEQAADTIRTLNQQVLQLQSENERLRAFREQIAHELRLLTCTVYMVSLGASEDDERDLLTVWNRLSDLVELVSRDTQEEATTVGHDEGE